MALNKTTIIPELDVNFPYLRVDSIEQLNQKSRNAMFHVRAYPSKEAAAKDAVQGAQVGVIRFTADAFDLYFSKAVLKTVDNDIYGQVYKAIKDWSEAIVIRRLTEQKVKDANNAINAANDNVRTFQTMSNPVKEDIDAALAVLSKAKEDLTAATTVQQTALSPEQVKLMWYAFISGPLGEQVFVGAVDA